MEQAKQIDESWKKEKLPSLQSADSLTTIYKHYILIFDPQRDKEEDCVVFNTQNGTSTQVKTGLNFSQRKYFSFCHWKNNIFILFETIYISKGSKFSAKEKCDANVLFLSVIENYGKVSFKVESFKLKNLELWFMDHFAYTYHDNLYIIGKESQSTIEPYNVHKFDLNERKWSLCQVAERDTIKNGHLQAGVLFGEKIFFVGRIYEPMVSEGGVFQPSTSYNGVTVLDLENMKWERSSDKNIIPGGLLPSGVRAYLGGDKIHLSYPSFKEFKVYDIFNKKVVKSEGLPDHGFWAIQTFENHSFLYQIFGPKNHHHWIVYQNYDTFGGQQKNDPLGVNNQQLPHMQLIWKEKPFTDITFVVQNEEIPAHRAILLKCRYFQNMFRSREFGWIVSNDSFCLGGMIEANSDNINVPDISETNFKAILEYIYCDRINLTEALAMELIILADKYFLPNLKTDCENYLSTKLTTANFIQVMKVTETADSEKLEKKVVSFLTSNIEKVEKEVDINLIPSELFVKAIIDLKSSKK